MTAADLLQIMAANPGKPLVVAALVVAILTLLTLFDRKDRS